MAKVPYGVETLAKISIAWVGCTNVTDRQTDRRWHIANMNLSSRSLKIRNWRNEMTTLNQLSVLRYLSHAIKLVIVFAVGLVMASPAFCFRGSVGADRRAQGEGAKDQSRCQSWVKLTFPQYPSEAYPELPFSTPFHYKIATRIKTSTSALHSTAVVTFWNWWCE